MIQIPACITCQHFTDGSLQDGTAHCVAFPNRIPREIARGYNEHSEPYPGDHGIQYLALPVKLYEYEHPTHETASAVLAAAFLSEVGRLTAAGDFRALRRYCNEHLDKVRPLLTPEEWAGVTDGALGWSGMCEGMEAAI